MVPTLRVL
jgi:hypothetical protein